MKQYDPNDFFPWFMFIDINYLECLDDDICSVLSSFDINNPIDQSEIIKIAILPEFKKLNTISKDSYKQVLIDIDKYPEIEVKKVIRSSSLPFNEELIDYKAFFKKVLHAIEQL